MDARALLDLAHEYINAVEGEEMARGHPGTGPDPAEIAERWTAALDEYVDERIRRG